MEFTFEEFLEMGLSADAYILLYYLVHENNLTPNNRTYLSSSYEELQAHGYIKLQENNLFYRQKILDLRNKINPEPKFEEFWDKYHEIVKEWNKTDKVPTEKYWKKLTKKEKQLAIDNIQSYYDSLPIYTTGKPVKKARTYLSDKNFNDNFKVEEDKKRSLNKMI